MHDTLWNIFIRVISVFIPLKSARKHFRKKYFRVASSSLLPRLNGNRLFLVKEDGTRVSVNKISGLNVVFQGSNSMVEVHEPFLFENCKFVLGNNTCVKIESSIYSIVNFIVPCKMESCTLSVGKNFSCIGCKLENHDERSLNVTIGDDCQFSYGVNIRTSDGHSIFDQTTKEILNKPQSGVKIGNHVWIGTDVFILKDVEIPDNSVIGARSLVNKKYTEPNVIIAGSPAKIIKRNINWDRRHTEQLEKEPNLSGV